MKEKIAQKDKKENYVAKIIKQIDILDKVSTTLKTEFKSTVYSDEVLEGFDKPCFY